MYLLPPKLLPLYFNVLNLTTNWEKGTDVFILLSFWKRPFLWAMSQILPDAVVLSVPALTVQQLPVNHPKRKKNCLSKEKHCNSWIQKYITCTMIKTAMSFRKDGPYEDQQKIRECESMMHLLNCGRCL